MFRIRSTALQRAGKLRFVSGYRFSDTITAAKSDAPLGAGADIRLFPQANSLCRKKEALPKQGLIVVSQQRNYLPSKPLGDPTPVHSSYNEYALLPLVPVVTSYQSFL